MDKLILTCHVLVKLAENYLPVLIGGGILSILAHWLRRKP